MSGYRVVSSADAVVSRPDHLLGHGTYVQHHRVDVVAWNDEPATLIAVYSGYDQDVVQFEVQDLDLFIELLQQTKALLEASPTDSGAAAPSPAAAASVPTSSAENR
ncbi:hypothetical protein [Paenarthrobacter nicotinovorans]|uniref:hypothetical protein n=1 Tax=Paenarthrobacter nicotinovorans TaxID=29320 RepID=UPI0024858EEA|nr:hypothetical protein [Paenarthrobacter nicotinovorans]MDI2019732.1 hypothetical protein [Paenarthrobacter nicotinovorans]